MGLGYSFFYSKASCGRRVEQPGGRLSYQRDPVASEAVVGAQRVTGTNTQHG